MADLPIPGESSSPELVSAIQRLLQLVQPSSDGSSGYGEPTGYNIHGRVTDDPISKAFLYAGNMLRYGKSEEERQADVYGLKAPGVRDVMNTNGQFDPAATERYTSANLFGERFAPPEWLQPTLHAISSGGRAAAHSVPLLANTFGIGEERPELRRAEELGMARGARRASGPSLQDALMQFYQQGRMGGY